MTKYSGPGTRHIGVKSATNVLHAIRFAAQRTRPLTTGVIINWNRLGIEPVDAPAMFRVLRAKVRRNWTDQCKRRGRDLGSFDDVAAHENPTDYTNTHWLIHVPERFRHEFRRVVTKFLRKVAKVDALGRALLIKRIPNPGSYAKYILKGVDPAYGPYFSINPIDQGFVSGRGRTSVGRSIGATARRHEGWVRKRRPRLPPQLSARPA